MLNCRALLLVLAVSACRTSSDPVRIGLAGPFSDPVGGPMLRAAQLAVAEINEAGGIGGRPIELVARDDSGDPDSAVAVAAELVSEGVVVVVGHVYSGTTLAAAPVYGAGPVPVPVVTPSSSSPEITLAGPHVFSLCPNDLEHGAALATWIHDGLRLTRGAVLYLNDPYGRGVRQSFVSRFTSLGGTITESDPYLGDSPDVGVYLDRISRAGADFVVVAGNRSEAEAILRQARSRGLEFPVFGGDGLEGIEAAGPLAEGVTLTAAYLPTIETPQNERFVRAYQSRYPDAGAPNQPAAATYDALYMLRSVIASTGATRRAIREGLVGLGAELPPFQGITGIFTNNGPGDLARVSVLIGVVRNGAVVPVESNR